jgi:cell division protease FtsH
MFGPSRKEPMSGSAPAGNSPLPDRRAREALLVDATPGLALAPDFDLALLAHTTTGLTAAELARLCETAGRIAAAQGACTVTMAHFAEALDRVVLAGACPILLEAGERSLAAWHEAGHAIAAWLIPAAAPPDRITILAHAGPGHRPEPRPAGDSQAADLASLLARLDLLLAGPAAEELGAGEISDAGEADSRHAAQLAGQIAARFGSAALLGSPTAGQGAPRKGGVERMLVEQRIAAVRDLLQRVRPALDRLAEDLVEEETVDPTTIAALLGPRPTA